MDEDIFGFIVVFRLLLAIVITICISVTVNHTKDIKYEKYKIEKQINIVEE